MKNTKIAIILTAILTGLASIATISAQNELIIKTTDNSSATSKTNIPAKRQSSSNDSWTGFYVGGFGGYTKGNSAANSSTGYSPLGYFSIFSIPTLNKAGIQNLKPNGFNGGVTFGYNYHSKHYFIGGETDFGSQRLSKSTSVTTLYPDFTPSFFTIKKSVKSNWNFTARPRGGVAFKRALLYATGGIAITNISYSESFEDNAQQSGLTRTLETSNFKKTKMGWTAGAGVEFKIANHWSAKAEYLFSKFGKVAMVGTSSSSQFASQIFTHSTDLNTHSFRFGVNFHF